MNVTIHDYKTGDQIGSTVLTDDQWEHYMSLAQQPGGVIALGDLPHDWQFVELYLQIMPESKTVYMEQCAQRWATICTVGFSGAVGQDQNPSAHGGVKHCQAKRLQSGRLQGRYVNSNGRHNEIGDPFDIDEDQLKHWQSIAKCSV